MKILIYFLVIATFWFSCNSKENPIGPLSESINPVSYSIGQEWLYRRYLINIGLSEISDNPDTNSGYCYFKVVDTLLIDNFNFYIIEGIEYYIGKDSIDEYNQKWAVHVDDTILKVVRYEMENDGFYNGPFKRKAILKTELTPVILRKMLYQKVLSQNSSGFNLEVYPLCFPLTKNKRWIYCYGDDKSDRKDMYREYLGQEKVKTQAGEFDTYKIDRLLSEFWSGTDGADDLLCYDWFNELGLIKRYFKTGKTSVYDEMGIEIGPINESIDILEYIGSYSIDPDTIKPFGMN